jgi:hypothetical protein
MTTTLSSESIATPIYLCDLRIWDAAYGTPRLFLQSSPRRLCGETRPANDLYYLPATYDNELVACNLLIVEMEQQDHS